MSEILRNRLLKVGLASFLTIGVFFGSFFVIQAYLNKTPSLDSNDDFVFEEDKEPDESIPDYVDKEDGRDKTYLLKTPNNNTKPNEYSVLDNIGFINYNIKSKRGFGSITEGKSVGKVGPISTTQSIYNIRKINKNYSYSKVNTVGIVDLFEEKFYTDDSILLKSVKKLDDLSKIDPKLYTDDDYFNMYGIYPIEFSTYIINENTILSSNMNSSEDKYTINLKLDPSIAGKYYTRQVQKYAGSNTPAVFSYIELDISFNSKWELLTIITTEKYNVKVIGVNTSVTTNLVEEFHYGNPVIEEEEYYLSFLKNIAIENVKASKQLAFFLLSK
ncbi:MAG: hypothetical protein ACRC5M_05895 [Anaeroplasmataceae bacterium]